MDIETFRNHCINKKGVTEGFPFDQDVLVFKVVGKMFALTSLKKWEKGDHSVNLKCDPDWAEELREQYSAITPGYHMSKIHWNTVAFNEDISDKMIMELIDHSYDLIVLSLTKKQREELDQL